MEELSSLLGLFCGEVAGWWLIGERVDHLVEKMNS
jgi:hypothetical protein